MWLWTRTALLGLSSRTGDACISHTECRLAALLELALARPRNQRAYGETDAFQLAASYAEAISLNHAFVDGNKRTASYVAVDFLEQNGFQLQAAKGVEHAEMMEQLGQGKITRDQAAAHLCECSELL